MPTAKKTAATPSAARKAASAQPDATALLKADHRRVAGLFEDFEKATTKARKASIVADICQELTVHAQLEEEIFYPAVKAALKDHELVPEATVEHATVKDLIAAVQDQEPGDEMYDARVTVMSEYVKHHVKEEEKQMFVQARKTDLDLRALGAQMAARKEELMGRATP